MQELRERARANLPTVLLTLLSIVQALALEFLWNYIKESSDLFTMSWIALLLWLEIAASLMGIMLIWIVYASHVMRLRWVPTTADSVYPFVIGLLEFILIESLGPGKFGWWMICNSVVFASMVWISHRTMKRARRDDANKTFFRNLSPATLEDFYPAIAMISLSAAAGVYLVSSQNNGWPALLALLGAVGIILFQFVSAAKFWEQSLTDGWPKKSG